MTDWTRRVYRPSGPPPLQEVRAAAQDLAHQAQHAPGKARLIFHTVADVALIGTAVISGALATVHLWKALFPRHPEPNRAPTPEAAGDGRSPPPDQRRRSPVYDGDELDHRHHHPHARSR